MEWIVLQDYFFSSSWKGENTKRCTRNRQGSSWRKRQKKQTTKQTGRRGNIRKNNRTGSEAIWIRSGWFEDSGRTCLRKQKFRTRREVRCVLKSSLGMKQGAEYSEAKGSGSRHLHTRPRQKSRTGQIPHLSNRAEIIQKLSWMHECDSKVPCDRYREPASEHVTCKPVMKYTNYRSDKKTSGVKTKFNMLSPLLENWYRHFQSILPKLHLVSAHRVRLWYSGYSYYSAPSGAAGQPYPKSFIWSKPGPNCGRAERR